MKQKTAIDLIKHGIDTSALPQLWYDLGAGSGLFSQALATLLPGGSIVHAVDKNAPSVAALPGAPNHVSIHRMQADFTKMTFHPSAANGFLMANSLHYVADQPAFVKLLWSALQPGGRLLLVEYDTMQANPWVPYPVGWKKLNSLLRETGLPTPVKLATTPSQYQSGGIYSALVTA